MNKRSNNSFKDLESFLKFKYLLFCLFISIFGIFSFIAIKVSISVPSVIIPFAILLSCLPIIFSFVFNVKYKFDPRKIIGEKEKYVDKFLSTEVFTEVINLDLQEGAKFYAIVSNKDNLVSVYLNFNDEEKKFFQTIPKWQFPYFYKVKDEKTA